MHTLRYWMAVCENLNEAIVHRDRFVQQHNDRRTVIAVNPTKSEWDRHFPRGAAGVLLKNGKIVIGDGNALDHASILSYANIPANQEKYRLQLNRKGAWAEIWLDYPDDNLNPNESEVREDVLKHYGETIEQIEAQLAKAVAPFMGSAPVKAIPLDDDQKPLIAGDQAFVDATFAGGDGRPVDLGY